MNILVCITISEKGKYFDLLLHLSCKKGDIEGIAHIILILVVI